MKKALVTGVAGQDGTYLSEYLQKKDYSVVGVDKKMPLSNNVEAITNIDITNTNSVFELVRKWKPDEIYCLAAYHKSSEDKIVDELETFKKSHDVNVLSVANFLEAIRLWSKSTRLFYAASSQMFGGPIKSWQDENSALNPNNIYGITKAAATKLCHYYRNSNKVFASVGILYAHESPLRTSNFVSKKIVETAVAIKKGFREQLVLGDIEAEADWGYAGDYVIAMHMVLQHSRPDDFIISSGVRHTLKDFVQVAFDCLGMDWRKFVVEDKNLCSRTPKVSTVGDNRKIVSTVGWKPTVGFNELVKLMVESELQKNE